MSEIIVGQDWSEIVGIEGYYPYAHDNPQINLGLTYSTSENETYAYRSKGYIGITRLRDERQEIVCRDGQEVILQITSRFHLDEWKMLDLVMNEPKSEYEEYIKDRNGIKRPETLYEIFDEKPIRVKGTKIKDSSLIVAIAYVQMCKNICMKQLKPQMTAVKENLTGKVRGKILIQEQLKKNVFQGRMDRNYCEYICSSIDCIENRILKAGLLSAQTILKNAQKTRGLENTMRALKYCITALSQVRTVNVNAAMFNQVKITGFYSYYKSALQYAKLLITDMRIAVDENSDSNQEQYVIPYVIKMEALFEFYCRAVIRKWIEQSQEKSYELVPYNRKFSLLHQGNMPHLQEHDIPDILIYEKESGEYYVFDAKYKRLSFSKSIREDSHQLFSYTLLFNAKRCGFIMPMPHEQDTKSVKGLAELVAKCKSIASLDDLFDRGKQIAFYKVNNEMKNGNENFGRIESVEDETRSQFNTFLLDCNCLH